MSVVGDGVDAPGRHLGARVRCWLHSEEASMGDVTTIGLDIAKTSFQAHGADASGAVVFRKKLSRGRLLAFFGAWPPLPRGDGRPAAGRASLGPRADPARPHGPADPAGLRQAVREAAEERRGRRRGDLRGGAAADDAVRGGQERRAAGARRGVPRSRSSGSSADPDHQRHPGARRRVRQGGAQGGLLRRAPRR